MFPLDRPHGAPPLENRGRVWVRDKGLSVWSAVKAFSLGIIPANSQTNVCGTADLTRPPETSSTSRLELENKQLPNPNSALKIKTPGSAPFLSGSTPESISVSFGSSTQQKWEFFDSCSYKRDSFHPR